MIYPNIWLIYSYLSNVRGKLLMAYKNAQAIYTVKVFKICKSILYGIVICGCKSLLIYEFIN